MIRDFNIEWLEARRLILAQQFQTFVTGAGIAAGDPVFTEQNATGISAISIAAAGDSVSTLLDIYDVDITKQIRFRVIWTQTSTTATDTVDWIVTYTPIILESTVLIDPATALNTAITLADASSGVADVLQGTSFGIINRNTLADTTEYLAVKVEADAIGTFSADEVKFVGLEMRYTPRRTAGPRRNILGGRRLSTTRPLGVQLHTTQEGL